ncbi:hypothetical protein BDV98DRAFT_94060 [Pterulicium gracile]|uniref:Uncharacterized protein n=1 Tax=Pterulicium gracile TaxID=1884261 RepID=A0A5C3QHK0_9AGAR|nr:hypothetical protein BDV98DRAFT_94060 [Pterula gracilis]
MEAFKRLMPSTTTTMNGPGEAATKAYRIRCDQCTESNEVCEADKAAMGPCLPCKTGKKKCMRDGTDVGELLSASCAGKGRLYSSDLARAFKQAKEKEKEMKQQAQGSLCLSHPSCARSYRLIHHSRPVHTHTRTQETKAESHHQRRRQHSRRRSHPCPRTKTPTQSRCRPVLFQRRRATSSRERTKKARSETQAEAHCRRRSCPIRSTGHNERQSPRTSQVGETRVRRCEEEERCRRRRRWCRTEDGCGAKSEGGERCAGGGECCS